MSEVSATVTPADAVSVSAAIRDCVASKYSSRFDRELCLYVLALSAVETRQWQAMVQWNLGNISCRASDAYDYWRPPWFGDDPKYSSLHARMLAGQAPSAFRAYGSLTEGASAFLAEVMRRSTLVSALLSGSAERVVRALHDTGYSADYSSEHVRTFQSLRDQFSAQGLFADVPRLPTPSMTIGNGGWTLVGGLSVLVGYVALRSLRKSKQ